MKNLFKTFIVCCILYCFSGCHHDNTGVDTPPVRVCKIDKIQSYGIITATIPEDFSFLYTGDNLTQINGVTLSNSDNFKAIASYTNGRVSKIETYGLDGTSTLQLTGYTEIIYTNNDITQLNFYEKLNGVFVLRYVHDLSYDGNGRRNKKVIKVFGAPLEQYTTTYTYDGSGNIIKMDEIKGTNQPVATFNFEYNNQENPFLGYHKQMDVFGWIFFDGPYYYGSARTDARFLSKYQMVKQIQSYVGSPVATINYSYSYDSDNKITQITSDGHISKAVVTYKCN